MAVEAQERVIVEETRRSIPRRFWDDEAWVSEHWDELCKQYPDQWVIVYNKAVVGADRDLGVASDVAEVNIGQSNGMAPVTFYIPEGHRVL